MNKLDKQYTALLQDILDNGVTKQDRTGTGTLSVFGRQIRHKMSDGFPLLTTKKMPFKTITTELLWFLRGDTNIKFLIDNNCHIWDGDAYKAYLKKYEKDKLHGVIYEDNETHNRPFYEDEFINWVKNNDKFSELYGDLGPVYGKQWRNWKIGERKLRWSQLSEEQKQTVSKETLENTHYDVAFFDEERGNDQIANLINDLKTNPDSRRLIVNSWNVGQLSEMILPPCHYGFQVYTRELSEDERYDLCAAQKSKMTAISEEDYIKYNIPTRAISLMFNMRSTDVGLGLGFNLASYGLLLMMIAKQVNMVPNELIYNGGDVHLYSNHIEQAKEQIGREMNHDEKVKYARSLYGDKDWWNINDNRVLEILHSNKRTREPYPLPTVKLSDRDVNDISEYTLDDIVLENYQSHPSIKMPLSN
jgi:thymidylate synthase